MVDASHWHYFITLERDFIRTLDFVALTTDNEAAYSDNFAKLLIATGSEIDGIAKAICCQISPGGSARNIMDYQSQLMVAFPGIETIDISVPRTGHVILPFADWAISPPKSPSWWRAFTNIKHARISHKKDGSQINCLGALCGLLALNLYYYRDEEIMSPIPDLLNYRFPNQLVDESFTRPPGT